MDGLPKDRARGQAAKTIIIWSILVLMFVAIYDMMMTKTDGDASFPWWILGGLIGFVLVVWVIVTFVNVKRIRAFNVENAEATGALHRGELTRAYETFTKWWESEIKPVAAISRHNAAWTQMRQGNLARAIEVQTRVIDQYDATLQRQLLLPTSIIDLALFHALLGNVDEADKQLAGLEQRGKISHNATYPAMNALMRAIVACRRGTPSTAVKILEDKWSEWEANVTGDLLRPMRVIRAFAIASVDMRDAGKAASVLGDMRPSWLGEFDFLGVEWPEMATFLATHNLATKQLAST